RCAAGRWSSYGLLCLRRRRRSLRLRNLRQRSIDVNMAGERGGRLTAAARRAQLIEVGRSVFAKRGYEATSVEEIAGRAKVSKPIVYEHIGGRIVEAMSTGSPRERLEKAALAFLTYVEERPDGFAILLRDAPPAKQSGEMPALMYDLAGRVGDIFAEQFRKAGYDAKAAPIYAHGLVGMVSFVGQWWRESRKPPPAETVASHVAALAWMGLRHLPKRPGLLSAKRERSR